MPISEDEFNRLPVDAREALLEKQRLERIRAFEYGERLKWRAIHGAVMATAGAMVLGWFVADSLVFWGALGLIAAGAGWVTVRLQAAVVGGILLIGGSCVLTNAIGASIGWCASVIPLWIGYVALGAVVGAWADGRRAAEDMGF